MSDHVAEWDDLCKVVEHLTQEEKVRLIEIVVQSLRPSATAASPGDQRANLKQLLRELDALPVQNPADGFTSRDHDDELYGEP